jgi:quercetin dioxygenase-like cupin family protein
MVSDIMDQHNKQVTPPYTAVAATPREHQSVVHRDQTIPIGTLAWNPHPKFPGVFLRHLVTGKESGGRLSLHHVRVDPGCSIGNHAHAGQVEVHDVLSGAGTCVLEGTALRYLPGTMGVMPADRIHSITADREGLLLLATFSPPLV